MFVVLTKDLPGVGQTHDLKNVKPGFFLNFLAPHGFATEATAALIDRLKAGLTAKKEKEAKVLDESRGLVKKLAGAVITISARASAKGSLFRALSEKAILDGILDQIQIRVEKSSLTHDPIKTVGVHQVKVMLGGETVEITVKVDAKAEENN